MSALSYLTLTQLKNRVKGVFRSPAKLIYAIIVVALLALVVFAALFLPRVILPQPLVTLWMPAAVVVTLLPLLVSALLDRRTDL